MGMGFVMINITDTHLQGQCSNADEIIHTLKKNIMIFDNTFQGIVASYMSLNILESSAKMSSKLSSFTKN